MELVWLQTGLWLAGGDQWKDWQLQLTVDNAVWPLVLQDCSSSCVGDQRPTFPSWPGCLGPARPGCCGSYDCCLCAHSQCPELFLVLLRNERQVLWSVQWSENQEQ